MKVIHVLKGKANPNTLNGVNKVIDAIARTQNSMGFEAEVWGLTATPERRPPKAGYPLRLYPLCKWPLSLSPSFLRDLDALLERDVVFHLHSVFVPELYAVSRELKKRGLQWVLSPHGGYSVEALRKNYALKFLYWKLLERKLVRGASAIQVLGPHGDATYLTKSIKFERIAVIPNGQDRSTEVKKFYQTDGPLQLVYCGRISARQKGLDLLLGAFALSSRAGISVILHLIGDGPDLLRIKRMVRDLGVVDKVIIHGPKFGEEKAQLIMRGDLFVHPSRWEGLPTAVLEAASMGLPVLVSEHTNIAEYVRSFKAGMVLPHLTVQSIADQIQLAAEKKCAGLLEDEGLSAREMIAKSFSWEAVVTQLHERVYDK